MRAGYGGMGGTGFGKADLPSEVPSHDNVRNETLGDAPPGVDAPNPEFIDNRGEKEKETGLTEKAVNPEESEVDSKAPVEEKPEMKKFLGSLPAVTAKQVRKKEGPAYQFGEDGEGDAPVQKGYNMERVRLAWDLHQAANKKPHYNLKKSDPVKGTVNVNGVEISIEWPKGSVRKYKEDGIMQDGKLMQASYGYVPDTITADGEELDVYVGANRRSTNVYLLLQKPTPWDIEQNNLEPEEKYMLGFEDMEEARKAFMGSMPQRFFKNIREVDWEYFIRRIERARKKLVKHTEMESCGCMRKDVLDRYDRSQIANRIKIDSTSSSGSMDSTVWKLVKHIDGLAHRVKSRPRLVIKLD
jgi:hypothetical protein